VHSDGIHGQWGLIRKDLPPPEEKHSVQRRGSVVNIHSNGAGTQGTARVEYIPQGHQKCQCVSQQEWHQQTRGYECEQGG